MIKIFGHKSPDTDSVGSAILWAWYLNNYSSKKATPYVLGRLNKETNFVLDKWNIPEPELLIELEKNDNVIIVDTNNPKELPSNINEVNIIRIIDHHMLAGGLSTNKPLYINTEPVACTATIIFDLLENKVSDFPDKILGLILSCILSDTLAFRSPTTTPHDKDVAEKIAKQLNINVQKYSNEMFTAKSDLSDFSDNRLVLLDSKKIKLGNKDIRISVIETTTPKIIIERKNGIKKAIEQINLEEKIDETLFFIIDIFKEESTVLIQNDYVKKIIEKSFSVTVESDLEILPGIISRKKQIIPNLKLPQ